MNTIHTRGGGKTIILSVILFLLISLFPAAAQETEFVFNEKDYTVLLSSLFGRVNRDIPEGAFTFVRDSDRYRARITHGIEKNSNLTAALLSLIQDYPDELADGYHEEIAVIQEEILRSRRDILPYTRSDLFLSEAVVNQYGLYTSFVDRFIERVNRTTSVENLRRIQDQSHATHRKITDLYTRIRAGE